MKLTSTASGSSVTDEARFLQHIIIYLCVQSARSGLKHSQ